MAPSLIRGVPYFEHPKPNRINRLNWEGIRVFLALRRTGALRAAAQELGIATNTVRRHLDLLEKEVGAVLVRRGYDGIELTPEGKELCEAVLPMENAAVDVQRIAQRGFAQVSGLVQIAVTEGIGTFWVTPRLVEFQRSHPKVIAELSCTMRTPDLTKMESDIAIQIVRPTDPDLKTLKLGRMHVAFFAARSYLETYGRPKSIADLGKHRLVEQIAEQINYEEYDRLFPGRPREGFVSVVTNTSTAHYWAVAKGAGFGALPTYLWAIGAKVEPLEVDFHLSYDIYLVYHPESKRVRRVAVTIDWLKHLFDPQEFPWFRDEYIPPQELERFIATSRARELFDVFSGFSR